MRASSILTVLLLLAVVVGAVHAAGHFVVCPHNCGYPREIYCPKDQTSGCKNGQCVCVDPCES